MGRKIKHFRALALIVAISAVGPFVTTGTVRASACTNSSNYGSATSTVNVPATGDYRIWSRIKVPSTAASTYQLEADGNTCWQVGGANVPVSTWTWVDWYGGNSSQKVNYNFTTTGNHTLKFIGVATNVQVDKVILLGTSEKCSDGGTIPSGDGANCATGPTATTNPPVTTPPVVVTATTGQEVVDVQPNQTITQGQLVSLDTSTVTDAVKVSTVQKIEFYDNGVLIETITTPPFVLDTNKLSTGSHTVKQLTYFKDGTTSEQSQLIEVKGAQDVQGSSAKNASSAQSVFIGVGSLIALVAIGAGVFWYIKLRPQGYTLRESFLLITRPFAALSDRVGSHKTQTAPKADVDKSYYAEPTVIAPDNKEK